MIHAGGCLCGAVRYEIDGALAPFINCHCRHCRRAHGAAFVTEVPVETKNLRFTRGEDAIARYEQRYFCGTCATRLFNRLDRQPDLTVVMVSTLDEAPATPPVIHLNTESKAPWYEIRDDAPQYPGFPPDFESAFDDPGQE